MNNILNFDYLKNNYVALTESFAAENPQLALIHQQAREKKLQFIPFEYYYYLTNATAAKVFTDFFKNGQSMSVGVTNIDNGKPPADEFGLVGSVRLLYGTYSSAYTDADMSVVSTTLRKGEIEIMQDGRVIMKRMPLERFNTEANTRDLGEIIISPKLLLPNKKIDVKIDSAVDCDAKWVMAIYLCGVMPYTL